MVVTVAQARLVLASLPGTTATSVACFGGGDTRLDGLGAAEPTALLDCSSPPRTSV